MLCPSRICSHPRPESGIRPIFAAEQIYGVRACNFPQQFLLIIVRTLQDRSIFDASVLVSGSCLQDCVRIVGAQLLIDGIHLLKIMAHLCGCPMPLGHAREAGNHDEVPCLQRLIGNFQPRLWFVGNIVLGERRGGAVGRDIGAV